MMSNLATLDVGKLGQPDDWGEGEDCGIIHQDGTWRDIPCAGMDVGYACSYTVGK